MWDIIYYDHWILYTPVILFTIAIVISVKTYIEAYIFVNSDEEPEKGKFDA